MSGISQYTRPVAGETARSGRRSLLEGEDRRMFMGVPWKAYEKHSEGAGLTGGMRVAYLDGLLEFMFPSYDHELRKSRLGRLLEAYCFENDVEFFEHGSTTLKAALKKAGKEPDESYCFSAQKKIPDLAIEIAITSGGIDALEIYRRFAVSEVWIWHKEKISVFVLKGGAYRPATRSKWLPDLDLEMITKCAGIESGLQARKKFLAGLKKGRR